METLIVESDEAYALAQELAERHGTSLNEAVIASLRASLLAATAEKQEVQHAEGLRIPTLEELTPKQRATYDALRALAREVSARKLPGATSDHSHLYDDFGLPK